MHVKSIHEGKRYSCDQCDYKATHKSSIIRHVKTIHEGERYPCTQCDYKATQTCDLHIHMSRTD